MDLQNSRLQLNLVRPQKKYAQRDQNIKNDYAGGMNLTEIAGKHGLSRQRVYQIVSVGRVPVTHEQKFDRNQKLLIDYFEKNIDIDALKDKYNLSKHRILQILKQATLREM